MKQLELLAPAKNLSIAICAINHGADAVYMGGQSFGARQSASNSIEDIEQAVKYAHKYHAKIYITLNTILSDAELEIAEKLIHEFYNVGADGLIIQDMGLLKLDLPPIALHASTQMHNLDIAKIQFYKQIGFKRVVLGRELSLEEIKQITTSSNIEIECFVHGALCVCYSGQCYLSYYMGNRSANRGVCAQPCRLAYSLLDEKENVLLKQKHLLSLKDMNRIDYLEAMAEVGVSSFKIEGRLKNEFYVANVVSSYRRALDKIIENNDKYKKSSLGTVFYSFKPDLEKTFNRGYTSYFIEEKREKMSNLNTPKSMGKLIGEVSKINDKGIFIATKHHLVNGDGICWLDKDGNLQGMTINQVNNNWIKANKELFEGKGTKIYINYDKHFFDIIAKNPCKRKINVNLIYKELEDGFQLFLKDESGLMSDIKITENLKKADHPQRIAESIEKQLRKSGDTFFRIDNIDILLNYYYFIPISTLNEARRKLLTLHEERLFNHYQRPIFQKTNKDVSIYAKHADYTWNISNHFAWKFYEELGVKIHEPALEAQSKKTEKTVFISKYCLRYELDACLKSENAKKLPINLTLAFNYFRFSIICDCKKCEMKLIPKK